MILVNNIIFGRISSIFIEKYASETPSFPTESVMNKRDSSNGLLRYLSITLLQRGKSRKESGSSPVHSSAALDGLWLHVLIQLLLMCFSSSVIFSLNVVLCGCVPQAQRKAAQ